METYSDSLHGSSLANFHYLSMLVLRGNRRENEREIWCVLQWPQRRGQSLQVTAAAEQEVSKLNQGKKQKPLCFMCVRECDYMVFVWTQTFAAMPRNICGRQRDNLGCWFLPSTLFEISTLLFATRLADPGASGDPLSLTPTPLQEYCDYRHVPLYLT